MEGLGEGEDIWGKNETEPKEAGGRENKRDKKKDLEMLRWEEICNTNSI